MSFTSTPLAQARRLDHHTFLNGHGPPQNDDPALVRYARLREHAGPSVGPRTLASPPKPDRWSVKDTTVNIANAFTLAAEDLDLDPTMQPAPPNPNTAWASGSRTTTATTNIPRSTSVEYEKETQSTSNRRFAPPPHRLAPPPSRNGSAASISGTKKKQLSKQVSVRHVPDSEGEAEEEGEEVARPARTERGKSPFEHVVDMTKRAFAPATFYLRQRSQEPSADPATANGHNASYDYSAEEREFQSQKPTSAAGAHHHKKGRISLDNKAYRPSASDLDDSDEEEEDEGGRKVRRRKTKKKEPHGGPLTTLPTVAGHEKKRRRKGRESKGNAMDMEDDSTGLSDEHVSEQRSAPNSRTSQPRAFPYREDDSGQIDTSADIEQGLDSIPEINEPDPTTTTTNHDDQYPRATHHHPHTSSPAFSIGGLLGRLVNLTWHLTAGLCSLFFSLIMMLCMLIGRVCGTAFEVVFSRPGRWIASARFGPVGKYVLVGLTVYAAWYTLALQDRSLGEWIPAFSFSFSFPFPFPLSPRTPFHAPEIPASNIAELSARLQAIENALSGLSLEHERARTKLDTEARTRAELVGRVGSLETRVQREGVRALEAEEQYRAQASLGLVGVRMEVEALQAQVRGIGAAGEHGNGEGEGGGEEARARLRALEERVGSVEGGVKEALEMGKHSVKAGVGSNAAWWNKLTTGRSGLTIKATDGQDVTSLIGHLVDSAVSQYGKDTIARPDFALHSSGAKTIPSLTSPTFEIRPSNLRSQLVGLVTGNGYAIGRPPVTALHHELHNGHCWPFAGTEGQLAVALAAPVYISDVTIDHVAKEVAFDMRSAPREMEVWGMVEGKDNIARVKAWQGEKAARKAEARRVAKEQGVPFVEDGEVVAYPKTLPKSPQYVRIANFTYDIHSPRNTQMFPVDEEVRDLGVDFGIVVLRIKSNWGRDEYTCLYRLRVHGQRMGETPLPYPEESA